MTKVRKLELTGTRHDLRVFGVRSNGSRLSCGRRLRERTAGRFGYRDSRGAQMEFYSAWAPVSFKRLLGGASSRAFGYRPRVPGSEPD